MQADTDSESRTDSPLAQAFARDVDARGLYFGPTLQQRVDLIEHLIEFGRQIIVLNGGVDSGRTVLLGHFASARRTNWRTVRVTAGPGLSAAGLLGQLATELDLDVDPEDAAGLPARLRQRIAALEKSGRIVVLLVDDADQLVPEVPPAIVQLAHTDDQIAELRVLLAADLDRSPLLEVLQRAHPQHGLVHVVEIPRLAEGQVKALIAQRLHAIGLDAESIFKDADYARITAASEGLVGKVVTLARQHVAGIAVAPPRAGTRRTAPRVPTGLVFGILAAGAVALGAWWAMRNPLLPTAAPVGGDVGSEQVEATPPAREEGTATSAEGPATTSPTVPVEAAPTAPAPPASPEVIATQVPAVVENPPTVSTTPPAAKATVPPPEAGPAGAFTPPLPEPGAEDTLPPTALAATPDASPALPPAAPVPQDPPRPPTNAPEPPPIPVSPVPEPPPVAAAPRPSRPPAPKVSPKPAAKAAVTAAAAPTIANFSGDWLLKQPATAHTLQLFGVRERAAAERYRQQRGIGPQSAVLTGTLDGRPWYIVVYGFYPTRGGAVAAMARLPPGLRDTKPWARSIGSLRDALR